MWFLKLLLYYYGFSLLYALLVWLFTRSMYKEEGAKFPIKFHVKVIAIPFFGVFLSGLCVGLDYAQHLQNQEQEHRNRGLRE